MASSARRHAFETFSRHDIAGPLAPTLGMIEWKADTSVRTSTPQPDLVQTPAGTFKVACFDDRPENYLPDSFFLQQSAPPKRVARRQPRRKAVRPAESRAAVG